MSTEPDLFGHAPQKPQKRNWSLCVPAPPGTGPEGQTCQSCRFCNKSKPGRKTVYKCALVKATRSENSDIRLKWAACRRWQHRFGLLEEYIHSVTPKGELPEFRILGLPNGGLALRGFYTSDYHEFTGEDAENQAIAWLRAKQLNP